MVEIHLVEVREDRQHEPRIQFFPSSYKTLDKSDENCRHLDFRPIRLLGLREDLECAEGKAVGTRREGPKQSEQAAVVWAKGFDKRGEDDMEGLLDGGVETNVGEEDAKKSGSSAASDVKGRGGLTHSSRNSGTFFVKAKRSSTCCLTTSC